MNLSKNFINLWQIKKNISLNQIRSLKQVRNFSKSPQTNTNSSRTGFILKSGLFTVAFGGVCYSTAVIANYERIKNKTNLLIDNSGYKKFSELRRRINEFWSSLPDVKKAACVIIFLNSLVFIGWRLRSVQDVLFKYFLLSPSSGRYSQMLLSTFSHQQLFHIFFNMFALYTMSGLLGKILPLEQFVAYYLTSGVFASFASSAVKILTNSPSALSLGASGAIVSCFALSSLVFPDSKFYVFPIPFEIEAQTLLKLLVCFDLGFFLMGSRRLDHAAHLGGVLYGYLFFTFGPVLINNLQSYVIKKWKSIRS